MHNWRFIQSVAVNAPIPMEYNRPKKPRHGEVCAEYRTHFQRQLILSRSIST